MHLDTAAFLRDLSSRIDILWAADRARLEGLADLIDAWKVSAQEVLELGYPGIGMFFAGNFLDSVKATTPEAPATIPPVHAVPVA